MTLTLDPATFRAFLNADVEVLATSYTPDGQGGATVTLDVARTVRGRLRPAPAEFIREKTSAARLATDFSHILYVEAGDEPEPGQSVRLAARPDERFRVQENSEPSYAGHHVAVRLMKEHDAEDEAVGS